MPEYTYDGFTGLRGIWGGNSDFVPPTYAQNAVNRLFRQDYNATRWGIQNIELEFENDEERIWFHGANGQGAFWYDSYPSYLYPKIAVSVGGRIFTIEVVGRKGKVRKLFDGNYRQGLHSWFVQGYEYLVCQDGVNPPMIWDGQNAAYRSDIAKNQIPIGSVMAFIHGRFILATADGKNVIRLSEIAGAANVNEHKDILEFPEVIPSFGIATNLGEVMGLYPMPYLDSGSGQYELTALCQNGFTSFDFRSEEQDLLSTQVQKISLFGTGCVGTHAFAGLNSDLFFRTVSGINTYRNSRLEFTQSWDQTDVSREVNYWLKDDRPDLLGTIPMVGWNNMVLTGCSPLIEPPSNPCFGYHRYCRGFTVFDAQSMSTAGRQGEPVWHGMWTGIRPWAFVKGRIGTAQRCFAFSYDRDGKNRLYEITQGNGPDYFEGQPRNIFSLFTSATLGSVEGRTSTFQPKKLNGGYIEVDGVLNASRIDVDYRPDGSPCWLPIDFLEPGCDCPKLNEAGCRQTSWPVWARKYFKAKSGTDCIPGTGIPADVFYHCQARVRGEGSFNVSRFNFRMNPQPNKEVAECVGNNCNLVACCPAEYDYSYHIAPLGENTEVPVLDCTPPVKTYTSTRIYRAVCSTDPSIFVNAQGQGTSTISQADADQKALLAAEQNAQEALRCPSCSTLNLITALIGEGGSLDLNAFFASGLFTGKRNQPVRLYDSTDMAYIFLGLVNQSGTIEDVTNYPAFPNGTWDTVTKTYTQGMTGSSSISLQIGCSLGGNYTWPPEGSY